MQVPLCIGMIGNRKTGKRIFLEECRVSRAIDFLPLYAQNAIPGLATRGEGIRGGRSGAGITKGR